MSFRVEQWSDRPFGCSGFRSNSTLLIATTSTTQEFVFLELGLAEAVGAALDG